MNPILEKSTGYSLNPQVVKKIIKDKLDSKPHNEEQFLFYHLHRNYFNVKNEIKFLTHIERQRYRDNLGHIWEEQLYFKSFYHMPKSNWLRSVIGVSLPYSRKFLRDDEETGIGGEFEIIIRHDGKRIDGLTPDKEYQETYNYGRTRDTRAHTILDILPHNRNSNYTFKQDMGKVKIAG